MTDKTYAPSADFVANAKISKALQAKLAGNPEAKTDLIEASYRDWEEKGTPTYIYQIVAAEDKSLVVDSSTSGLGARPHVTPRWSVAAGECYGRGPLISALPAIRNLLPGSEAPTVLPLDGVDDKVAVHAVCRENVFWETLENLKAAGASSLLVLPVEKMLA